MNITTNPDCSGQFADSNNIGSASDAVTFAHATKARERIAKFINRTPLLRSSIDLDRRIHLKCENLQITRSFKIRGGLNALLTLKEDPALWKIVQNFGVMVCSSGNFAIAMAYASKMLGIDLSLVVHTHVAPHKLKLITEIYSRIKIITVSPAEWQEVMITSHVPHSKAVFVSSEDNFTAIMGNATIALEIIEEKPEVKSVIIPYGGGGLTFGIGSLLKLHNPAIKVITAESSTGAPYFTSRHAGKPVLTTYRPSFVDGIGANFVIPTMFQKAQSVVDRAEEIEIGRIAATVKKLAVHDGMVVEGAGAASVAAALYSTTDGYHEESVCIISGANIGYDLWSSIAFNDKEN